MTTTLSASANVVDVALVLPSRMLISAVVVVTPSRILSSAVVEVTPSKIFSSAPVDVIAVPPSVMPVVVRPAMTKSASAYPVAPLFTVVLGAVCVSLNILNVPLSEAS